MSRDTSVTRLVTSVPSLEDAVDPAIGNDLHRGPINPYVGNVRTDFSELILALRLQPPVFRLHG